MSKSNVLLFYERVLLHASQHGLPQTRKSAELAGMVLASVRGPGRTPAGPRPGRTVTVGFIL